MPFLKPCTTWYIVNRLLLVLFPLLLLPGPAEGETVTGTVVEVHDRKIVLSMAQTPEQDPRLITVRVSAAAERAGKNGQKHLPPCVRPGKRIWVTGHFTGQQELFIAETIRGRQRYRHHGDPTGVRRRLGQQCGRLKEHSN